MNQTWQDFLASHQAQFQDGAVEHFGDALGELTATQYTTVLCDLSQFGILKVSGEDAQGFLQNLLSSDVKTVTPVHAQLSSFNTGKGRMLATFLIWQTGADYYLHLPRSLCAAMQKKLSMYVLRAKVKITDASDDIICLGSSGKGAEALLKELVGPTPNAPMAITQCVHTGMQNAHLTTIRLGDNRFQLITTPQHAPEMWKKFSAVARPVGSPCWDWLNIRAGIPVILPATQEQFVPQMANLDLTGGVNFKKGCYPGQEIVARMQYLGKLKQRMYLAHVEDDAAPQPGDKLYSAEMEGQNSGMVMNSAAAPGGGYDLLAVVQISSRENQSVHLGALQGAVLQFQPLPYALP